MTYESNVTDPLAPDAENLGCDAILSVLRCCPMTNEELCTKLWETEEELAKLKRAFDELQKTMTELLRAYNSLTGRGLDEMTYGYTPLVFLSQKGEVGTNKSCERKMPNAAIRPTGATSVGDLRVVWFRAWS